MIQSEYQDQREGVLVPYHDTLTFHQQRARGERLNAADIFASNGPTIGRINIGPVVGDPQPLPPGGHAGQVGDGRISRE